MTGKVPASQLDVKGYSLAGKSNFNSTTGVVINHTLGHTNYIVLPIPSANPNGYLGEVWVEV